MSTTTEQRNMIRCAVCAIPWNEHPTDTICYRHKPATEPGSPAPPPSALRSGTLGPVPVPWREHLAIDPKVSESSPVVRGTRVTAARVITLVIDGWSCADILRAHPELTVDDIRACMACTIAMDGGWEESEGEPVGVVSDPDHHTNSAASDLIASREIDSLKDELAIAKSRVQELTGTTAGLRDELSRLRASDTSLRAALQEARLTINDQQLLIDQYRPSPSKSRCGCVEPVPDGKAGLDSIPSERVLLVDDGKPTSALRGCPECLGSGLVTVGVGGSTTDRLDTANTFAAIDSRIARLIAERDKLRSAIDSLISMLIYRSTLPHSGNPATYRIGWPVFPGSNWVYGSAEEAAGKIREFVGLGSGETDGLTNEET